MITKTNKNHSMSKRIRLKKLTATFPQLPCWRAKLDNTCLQTAL